MDSKDLKCDIAYEKARKAYDQAWSNYYKNGGEIPSVVFASREPSRFENAIMDARGGRVKSTVVPRNVNVVKGI